MKNYRRIAITLGVIATLTSAVLLTSTTSAGATTKWSAAHPCTGVTKKTTLTKAMIPKVGNCAALQAPAGTVPAVYTRGGPNPADTRIVMSDGIYELCLTAAFHIPFGSNGIYPGFCRKTAKGKFIWTTIEGVRVKAYNNDVAQKIDETLIELSQQHRKSDSTKILKSCSAGAIGGVIASIASGPGIIFGATGGCVGGALTVVFTDH